MTVLMTDAQSMLSPAAQAACLKGELEDTLFADDALIISSSGANVEEYMAAVESKGKDYGLQVHWGKVHLITVGSTTPVKSPTGAEIPPQDSMLYLGSTIHKNGKFGCEISRKNGAASAEFRALQPVWRNASLPKRRKIEFFRSLILSKLRYGFASAWLSKADLRRLDGFQARCLRKMLKVPPAFISRISNERVRQIVDEQPFSKLVRATQLKLLGQVFMDPNKKQLRQVAFQADGLTPATEAFVRKVGRPKHNWVDQLTNIMRQAAGSLHNWQKITTSMRDWNMVATRVLT